MFKKLYKIRQIKSVIFILNKADNIVHTMENAQ